MPVVFDATATGQVAFASTVSFSHTCSAGADRLLLVAVVANNNVSIASVTYNGVAMTPVETGNAFQRLYALVAPATGANTVLVTLSGAESAIARSVSYTGAVQSLPTGVQASAVGDAGPSVTVSSASGALVVGMSSYIDLGGQALQTAGAGQTSRGSGEQSGHYLIVSDEAGAASVVHSYTRTGGFYYHQRIVAVSVAEAVAGPPTLTSVTPANARVGDTVTFNGTNLTGATAAGINGTNVTGLTVINSTQAQGVVAAGTTSGATSITTPLGTASGGPSVNIYVPAHSGIELTNPNANHTLGVTLAAMTLRNVDQFGATFVGSTPAIVVSPRSARTVTGTTSRAPSAGTASFNDLVPALSGGGGGGGGVSLYQMAQLRAVGILP